MHSPTGIAGMAWGKEDNRGIRLQEEGEERCQAATTDIHYATLSGSSEDEI